MTELSAIGHEDRLYLQLKYGLPFKFENGDFFHYALLIRKNLPEEFNVEYFGNVLPPKINGNHYDTIFFMDDLMVALFEYDKRNSNNNQTEIS